MKPEIYCMVASSVSLSERMVEVLFDSACLMIQERSSRKLFYDDQIEGLLKTSFTERSLNTVVGVEFSADIETRFGRGYVKFLVRPASAEVRNSLKWVPFFDIYNAPDMEMDATTESATVH